MDYEVSIGYEYIMIHIHTSIIIDNIGTCHIYNYVLYKYKLL